LALPKSNRLRIILTHYRQNNTLELIAIKLDLPLRKLVDLSWGNNRMTRGELETLDAGIDDIIADEFIPGVADSHSIL
jgi:hypothetical protein